MDGATYVHPAVDSAAGTPTTLGKEPNNIRGGGRDHPAHKSAQVTTQRRLGYKG